MDKIFNQIKQERARQHDKWGEQNHNLVEWMAILIEEVGEVSKEAADFHFENGKEQLNDSIFKAVQQGRLVNYRKELIQVAAVATQMIESLDRNRSKYERYLLSQK